MRSRSCSTSAKRRGRNYRTKHTQSRRSASSSPTRKDRRDRSRDRTFKRKSDVRRDGSDSPKRRRRGEAEVKSKERPRKREADSTNTVSRAMEQSSSDASRHRSSNKRDKHKHSEKVSKKPQHSTTDTVQGIERPFDQTDQTLDSRFSVLAVMSKPFEPEENVTIEIERVVAGRAVPFAIPPFWSDAVQVPRRSDEGVTPLSSREEFETPEEVDDEKRTVKVKHGSKHETSNTHRHHSKEREHRHRSFREERSQRNETGRSDERTARSRLEGRTAFPVDYRDNFVVTRDRTDGDGRSRPIQRSVTANTGRSFLLPAAAAMAGELQTEPRLAREGYRSFGSASASNLLSGYRSMPSLPLHQQFPPQPQVPQLPDFSHRPDKYQYEEWRDRPELIPKGRSYYEHDDRGADDDRWDSGRNFRGRGGAPRGFGGRGLGGRGGGLNYSDQRRSYRPRSPFGGGLWKHDKFEELQETEPTDVAEQSK